MKAVGILAAAVALATPAGSPASNWDQTGLHGFVRKGPITPVCDTEACDGPAAGVTLTFSRDDGVRVRAVTRDTGFYRVKLAPGRYTVTADLRVRQTFSVKNTRVAQGRDGRLDFFIDTGLQ